jgi:thiamine biosynthesis lipoprotein
MRRKFSFTFFALCVIFLSTFTMSACDNKKVPYVKVEGVMLGTFLNVTAQTDCPTSMIYEKMMEIDAAAKASMSIFDENSLLSRINAGQTDVMDEHILHCLELAQRVSALSDGAYDVTVAPLVKAYGFAGGQRSEQIKLDSLLEFVGIDKLRIEGERLIKSDERVQIDFNSIAKGYVVDLAAQALEQMGIENYLVDIGGEIRCRGLNSKGGAWRTGIESPVDGNDVPGAFIQQVLSLSDCAMATSGNYRRFYLDEHGRKVAHTIDPKTGESVVTDLLSATVVASTCAEADAYGTMFMAMGKQRAIELAHTLAKQGVMVYFITAGHGAAFEVYYSQALFPVLKSTEGCIAIK